jgi:hypothetical protein
MCLVLRAGARCLRRRLRRPAKRLEELRCVRHSVPERSDLPGREVLVPARRRNLRRRLHQNQLRSVELRQVRSGVRGRRGLRGGKLRPFLSLGPRGVRRIVHRCSDGPVELRRLRSHVQPGVRVRRGIVRLPERADRLWRPLRLACERPGALRRLLQGLRGEPSVRPRLVFHGLPTADGQLRRRVRGRPERSTELRRLRYPVYWWRGLRERSVRVLTADHPVQRSVRQRVE